MKTIKITNVTDVQRLVIVKASEWFPENREYIHHIYRDNFFVVGTFYNFESEPYVDKKETEAQSTIAIVSNMELAELIYNYELQRYNS